MISLAEARTSQQTKKETNQETVIYSLSSLQFALCDNHSDVSFYHIVFVEPLQLRLVLHFVVPSGLLGLVTDYMYVSPVEHGSAVTFGFPWM